MIEIFEKVTWTTLAVTKLESRLKTVSGWVSMVDMSEGMNSV